MCCFSASMTEVTDTRIFARMVSPDRQLVVYQMQFATSTPVAMILPIPVAAGAAEAEVRFVSFEGDATFFGRLDRLFHDPSAKGAAVLAVSADALAVHSVGSFEASFVPTQAAFSRLDPRFRIDPELWSKIPVYADYGFVVFQLASVSGRPHPMAFTFPTRMAGALFFPTIHVHDGAVHPMGDFDHQLYAQAPELDVGEVARIQGFARSESLAGDLRPEPPGRADGTRAHGGATGDPAGSVALEWLDREAPVYRARLRGSLPNRDTVVPLVAALAAAIPVADASTPSPESRVSAASATEPALPAATPAPRPEADADWSGGIAAVAGTALAAALAWVIGRRMRRRSDG